MSNITPVSLETIRRQKNGPIYVINNAHNVIKNGGDIFITVTKADGNGFPIQVPKTWLAIDMTTRATRKSVLESSNFLDAVANRLILLVDAEDAHELNNRPGAQAERARLQQRENEVRAATASRGLSRNTKFTVLGQEDLKDDANPRQSQTASVGERTRVSFSTPNEADALPAMPEAEVSASFRAWVQALNGVDSEEAVSRMRSHADFEIPEIQFLRENVKHKIIIKWAEQALAE